MSKTAGLITGFWSDFGRCHDAVAAVGPAAAAGGQEAAGAGVNSRINFPPEDSDSDDDDEGGQVCWDTTA